MTTDTVQEPTLQRRVEDLIGAIASRAARTSVDVANDVGRRVGPVIDTVESAWNTTVGQTRSATGRAISSVDARRREVTGQARAQAGRVTTATGDAAVELVDDATRAVRADGHPAALEDWTVADLQIRARELDVTGRSSMSKSELVRAIRSVD